MVPLVAVVTVATELVDTGEPEVPALLDGVEDRCPALDTVVEATRRLGGVDVSVAAGAVHALSSSNGSNKK